MVECTSMTENLNNAKKETGEQVQLVKLAQCHFVTSNTERERHE